MSTFNFQPDDPRLTAYALGELDPNERAEVEAMLSESSEARMALEEIRETIGLLSRELTFEPALTLTMTQRQSVELAASTDNGERLGVSPPCGAVQHTGNAGSENTEGLRPAARRTLVAERVQSRSRWGTIARAATTVAAVTVAAVGVLYVSRVFEHEESSFAKSDSTPVYDEQAWPSDSSRSQPRHAEMAGLGSDSSARAVNSDLSQPTADESAAGTTSESLAQTISAELRSRPGELTSLDSLSVTETSDAIVESSQYASVGDPVEGTPPSRPELAELMRAQSSPATSESSIDRAGKSNDDVAMQMIQESRKSQGDESPFRIADSPLLAENTVGGSDVVGKSDSQSTAMESKVLVESEALAESEARAPLASAESERERLSQELARQKARLHEAIRNEARSKGRSRPLSDRFLEPSVTSARGDLGLGGVGVQELFLEMRRLAESEELSKDQFTRFRSLSAAVPGTEAYEPIVENAFLTPMEQPLSTFSIDVDTASYANMRRFIQQGQLPPANAVRIEELVNYFRYDYPEPADGSPFSVNIDVATCPWNPQNKLARVGLKAKTIAEDKRPATNLVFLIDVSGSMAAENKLPLVKQALSVLVSKMGEDDQIAIVTYAGEAGLKLNSTSGSQRAVIQQAIDSLQSGGSTNGAAGINIAYDTAIQSFIKGGANRVILCTDGDFNVGVSDDNTLVEMIQEKAASGVFLSVFGFGMGNLKDAKLEKLADKGNGNYGYIDGLGEARKVFGEQLSGTLVTVAKDVKLQLEFNNSTVGAYRLIGYENRVLAAKDFDDDTKDAGEIGAGHTVTALYEIVPKAAWLTQAGLDPEKFDIVEKPTANDETREAADGRLFTVKLRHKLPDAETSEKSQDYAAMNSDAQLSDSNVDFRFAAAVASFGMQLRESKFRGNWTL